jgi:hypothetical protein
LYEENATKNHIVEGGLYYQIRVCGVRKVVWLDRPGPGLVFLPDRRRGECAVRGRNSMTKVDSL